MVVRGSLVSVAVAVTLCMNCLCCCRKNPRPIKRRFPTQRNIEQGENLARTRGKENQTLHYLNVFILMKHFRCIMYFMYCLHPHLGDVSGCFKVHLCFFKKVFSFSQVG